MSEAVEVTGADREAILYIIGSVLDPAQRAEILSGKRDSLSVIQLLARHRHEATRALSAQVEELRDGLDHANAAIAEYYRYWTGGETRGSYDGKPERASLWQAMYDTRALLAKHKETGA